MLLRLALLCLLGLFALPAQAQEIKAVTVEGGPIASKHFQPGDHDFHERHSLGILKVETEEHGNWGLYVLTPNSVEDTSIGAAYVTDPYVVPVGSTRFEFTGALGLVTGYQDFPLPLIAAQARWVAYESGPWNAGLSVAAIPYLMEDERTGDNEAGIVATTPFLSVRYRFQ